MEIQIKKAIKAGNSSAVILPRSWLNENVRVELIKKTPDIILSDILEIVKKNIDLKEIIGIYLTGSYARQEEDENSDIDILVLTSYVDKEMINNGIYNILIVSEKLLKQKLDIDLLPIGQMIKEAKPLLNSSYLDSIDLVVTEKNVRWYIDTTEDKLNLIKEIINKLKNNNINLSDKIIYTLILRIRTLYIIEKLIKNKDYSKQDFIKLIKRISKGNSYERYLSVKNNLKEKKEIKLEEVEVLYEYLKNQLSEIKGLVKQLKK